MFDYHTSRALQEHRYAPVPERGPDNGDGPSPTRRRAMKRMASSAMMATGAALRRARSISNRAQPDRS